MTIKDLFDFELSDGIYVSAWSDEDFTYLNINFVSLCLPNELFDELLAKLTQYQREKDNHTEVI